GVVLFGRADDPAADPHAVEVTHRLAEYGKPVGHHAVGTIGDPLTLADKEFVVDVPVPGEQPPSGGIVDRDHHGRGDGDPLEVLPAPGIHPFKRHPACLLSTPLEGRSGGSSRLRATFRGALDRSRGITETRAANPPSGGSRAQHPGRETRARARNPRPGPRPYGSERLIPR